MKKRWYLIFLLSLVACERSTDWEPESNSPSMIVVEGRVTNELAVQRITLSRTTSSLNSSPLPLKGANVSISDGSSSWVLIEDDSIDGRYVTTTAVAGEAGKTYTLQIVKNDTVLTATDKMPGVTDFVPLKYAKTGSGHLYQISWVANGYHPAKAAMYEIMLDWSALPAYADSSPEHCRALLYYFTLTTIDVSDLFSPAISKTYFPAGTVITERKYSLSPEYEEFLRCLLLESSWRGGLWDAIPGNLPTNINPNGLGFFNASAVQSSSMVVGP